MKRIAFTLLIAMFLNIANAFAQGGTTGPLTWNIADGVLTISGEGAMPDYGYMHGMIPPWNGYHRDITTVVIENEVTHIGDFAFAGLDWSSYSITSITLPNNLTSIGSGAFWYCRDLTLITLPNKITNIKGGAFRDCSNLTSITLPNGITSIQGLTFLGCDNLASITLPSSITRIGEFAFCGCRKLTSITLPKSIENIENQSFAYCSTLTLITNLNPIPIDINSDVFENINVSACTLEVPIHSVSAYKNAEVWKEFNIVGIEVGIVETDNYPSLRIFPNPTNGKWRIDNGELTI